MLHCGACTAQLSCRKGASIAMEGHTVKLLTTVSLAVWPSIAVEAAAYNSQLLCFRKAWVTCSDAPVLAHAVHTVGLGGLGFSISSSSGFFTVQCCIG